MNLTQTIFEVIDMRSFSNLWYWIALAVVWSTTSHWVLGVPFDMVGRARKHGDTAMSDLEDMVRINVGRMLYITRVSGLIVLGFVAFILTSLAILAFWYDVEFAQAVFLILFPLSLVAALSVSTARLIEMQNPLGEDLCKRLTRHRVYTQVIGMASIFVTTMFGMYQNLVVESIF